MKTLTNTLRETYHQIHLDKVSSGYKIFADEHPLINKIIILANHLFRLMPMIALMQTLPFSQFTNCGLMLNGSLMYRVTIERLCPLRFALLSCFGAAAYSLAQFTAFSPLGSIPLVVYAISVIHTSFTSNDRVGKPSCCKAT